MKNFLKNIFAAAVISAAFVGSASAMTATDQSVWSALQSNSVNAQSLSLSVDNGVVTIAGDVDSGIEREQIARAVLGADGVTGIINLVTAN